jgi:hypothetical protein
MYLKFKVSRTLQTIIVTGISKKYTKDAASKKCIVVIVDGGQLQ